MLAELSWWPSGGRRLGSFYNSERVTFVKHLGLNILRAKCHVRMLLVVALDVRPVCSGGVCGQALGRWDRRQIRLIRRRKCSLSLCSGVMVLRVKNNRYYFREPSLVQTFVFDYALLEECFKAAKFTQHWV